MKRICFFLILPFSIWLFLVPATEATEAPESAAADEYGYIGNKNCWKCHIKEFKSWKETKMASAFDLLKPGQRAKEKRKAGLDPNRDYTQDPECLPCHVTGYGEPGGFVDIQQSPQLAGVGCEVCHGAGSEYTKDPHMSLKNKEYKLSEVIQVGLASPVSEESCTGCHNEKSPFFKEFDFQARKDEGTHKVYPLKFKHE